MVRELWLKLRDMGRISCSLGQAAARASGSHGGLPDLSGGLLPHENHAFFYFDYSFVVWEENAERRKFGNDPRQSVTMFSGKRPFLSVESSRKRSEMTFYVINT